MVDILAKKPRVKLKPRGRPFQKGNVPKSPGRPLCPPELRQAKDLTTQLFQDTLNQLLTMKFQDMREYLRGKECSSLERAIGGQIVAAGYGNSSSLAILFDRKLGAVEKNVNVNVTGTLSHKLANMSDEQKMQRLKELNSALEDKTVQEVIEVEPVSITTKP